MVLRRPCENPVGTLCSQSAHISAGAVLHECHVVEVTERLAVVRVALADEQASFLGHLDEGISPLGVARGDDDLARVLDPERVGGASLWRRTSNGVISAGPSSRAADGELEEAGLERRHPPSAMKQRSIDRTLMMGTAGLEPATSRV
jgi:hypothetical protein